MQGAGSAGGVVQTGQRVGSAFGVAVVGAVFFDAVARGHGAWDTAYREAVTVSIGFVLIALAGAIADVVRRASSAQARTPDEPANDGCGQRAGRSLIRWYGRPTAPPTAPAYAARMEQVLGIGGVFFRSADPAALARWYEANLGINVFPATDDWWMQQGGPTVLAPFPADTDYFGRPDQQQ